MGAWATGCGRAGGRLQGLGGQAVGAWATGCGRAGGRLQGLGGQAVAVRAAGREGVGDGARQCGWWLQGGCGAGGIGCGCTGRWPHGAVVRAAQGGGYT